MKFGQRPERLKKMYSRWYSFIYELFKTLKYFTGIMFSCLEPDIALKLKKIEASNLEDMFIASLLSFHIFIWPTFYK